MPNIKVELSDFKDSKYFASQDLGAGYWQCLFDLTSYDAFGINTPQECLYLLVGCTVYRTL